MTARNQADVSNQLDGAALLSSHHYASLVVLGVALSIVIYVAVGLVWLSSKEPYGGSPQMRVPIYAGALFLAMGAIVLRRTQLRWLKLETITGLRGVEGLLKYLVSTTIVLVVIAEIIGLLGLVICLFGGTQRDLLALGATGLVLALSTYPKRTAWEKTVKYLSADAQE
jgi:hypothetical protein